MAKHLDSAEEADLLALPGVGQSSVNKIITFRKSGKSFTTLAQLTSCAPQLEVAKFQLLHHEGTWSSNIAEFAVEQPDNIEPGATSNVSVSKSEQPKAETNLSSLETLLTQFINEQKRTNDQYDLRIKQNEAQLSEVSTGLKTLTDNFTQMRLELNTSKVIESHYAKGPGVPGAKSDIKPPSNPQSLTEQQPMGGKSKLNIAVPQFGTLSKTNAAETDGLGVKPKSTTTYLVNDNNAQQLASSRKTNNAAQSDSRLPDTRYAKLVDKFEGKVGTWENWFHKFEITAEMCQWSDENKLFMLTNALTGSALTAHRNLPKYATSTYESAVTALTERFGKVDKATKSVLRAELACIKQTEGEALENFADRVYSLTMDAHPPNTSPEQLQIYAVESFLSGCLDKNSAWLTCNVKNPVTINEAVNQMKLAQSSSKRMGMKYAVRCIATSDDDKFDNSNRFEPEVRRLGKDEDKCFKCGGRWHFARECPNEQCEICGGTGHKQSSCPAKWRKSANAQYSRQKTSTNSNKQRARYQSRRISPSSEETDCALSSQDEQEITAEKRRRSSGKKQLVQKKHHSNSRHQKKSTPREEPQVRQASCSSESEDLN